MPRKPKPPGPVVRHEPTTNPEAEKMQYRAMYRSREGNARTEWHPSAEVAQDYLAKKIGWFHHLGDVRGDVFENGQCASAPRNGGLVSLESR